VTDPNPPRPPLGGGDRLRVPAPPRIVRFTRSDGREMVFTTRVARALMGRPDQSTGHGRTGMVGGCTPEAFADLLTALRAELAGARPVDRDRMLNRMMRPGAFEGRPWVWQAITLAEAADLTGMAVTSLRRYGKPSDRNGEKGRKLPGPLLPAPLGRLPPEGWPRTPPNVWECAAIALWYAGTPRSKPQPGRRRAPASNAKDQRLWSQTGARRRFALLAFLRALIREDTAIGPEQAAEMVAAAGIDTAGLQVRHAYADARHAEAATFIQRLQGECVRPDGYVTVPQIAAVYGVPAGSLYRALARGELAEAGRDGKRILVDPSRLRMQDRGTGSWGRAEVPRPASRIPVDMDFPRALPLPLRLSADGHAAAPRPPRPEGSASPGESSSRPG
jgi:hypothetical protein